MTKASDNSMGVHYNIFKDWTEMLRSLYGCATWKYLAKASPGKQLSFLANR